jgi:hypothetical protein
LTGEHGMREPVHRRLLLRRRKTERFGDSRFRRRSVFVIATAAMYGFSARSATRKDRV